MPNLRIDDSTRLIGSIRLGDGAYIAQGSVIRSINDSLTIGNSSWVLENSVFIGTPEHPVKIGSKTVFGHKSLVIGAQVGDLCEVGNGVIFLPGAKIGNMCIFGEGTIVAEGQVIPDGSVAVGRPARVIRSLTQEDRAMITRMRSGDISLSPYAENIIHNQLLESDHMGKLYEYNGKWPLVSESAVIYDSAEITGDVIVGDNVIIASGVKIIGNSHGPVRIGNNVQILENTVLHLLPDNELIIDEGVTIGPGCIIHGTHLGANSVVEAGAIVCDYSRLGQNTLVKAGSLVKQRSVFADHEILEGFPAKSIGKNTEEQKRPVWAFRQLP